MKSLEPIQPNEWNVYASGLAETPAKNASAPKAMTKEEGDPQPVVSTRDILTRTSEDVDAKLGFSNH